MSEDLFMDLSSPVERVLESAKKGAAKSNRTEGKKERQEEMFPKLQAEIEGKRKELFAGLRFPNPESRRTPEFRDAAWKECSSEIGGAPEQQLKFSEKIVIKHCDAFG